MLSKACEYGIRASVFLAQKSKEDKLSTVKEIAKAIDSPVAFTAKVMQLLVRSFLVSSVKGPQGGFYIEKKVLKKLNLLQIVCAIDGDGLLTDCVLGLNQCCDKNPCPMHNKYKFIRKDITKMLQVSLVNNLTGGLLSKKSVLRN